MKKAVTLTADTAEKILDASPQNDVVRIHNPGEAAIYLAFVPAGETDEEVSGDPGNYDMFVAGGAQAVISVPRTHDVWGYSLAGDEINVSAGWDFTPAVDVEE